MKDKLLYSLAYGTLSLLAMLPLGALYQLSNGLYALLYRCLGYRRGITRQNLLRCFPEKTEEEIKRIERGYYRHLCDCIVETIALLRMPDEELEERAKVINGELIDQLAADGRSIVLYLGHYGNWEWVPVITRHFTPLDLNGQIYRPVHNKVMDRLMLRIRSRFSSESIPQKSVFRRLVRMHREGKQFIVAFIADQRPNSNVLSHWTSFLGQETAYVAGGDEIGKMVDAHYVYIEMKALRRGYYTITFREIRLDGNEGENPYMLSFLRMLEQTIRQAPEQWLWSHRRWLFAAPEKKQ
ncbi:MAG: lipd A biosynthesis protein [Prevotellaceae bacterium]|nr:lipd A biosynthesis protein [Prevotellaceae bacterium]